jgi:phosphoserine phosphatase RsbU/P
VLADISGKGMAAALLMANLQAAIRGLAPQMAGSLPGMLRALNQQFRESTAPEHYATLLLGHYDDESRVLRYVNCGHPAGLVVRGGQVAAALETTAPVIGVLPDLDVEVRGDCAGAGGSRGVVLGWGERALCRRGWTEGGGAAAGG